MEAWLQTSIHAFLAAFALPKIGLPAIFLVSLVSATLLPLGSEPAVFAYVQLVPTMFWPAVLVATVGNTLGGVISYAMGAAAERTYRAWLRRHPAGAPDPAAAFPSATSRPDGPSAPLQPPPPQIQEDLPPAAASSRWQTISTRWFQRFGPPALLLSWLPGIGDPLCAVAGWLRLAFWPCVAYMAIGKCLRYIVLTLALLHAWPWFVRLLPG